MMDLLTRIEASLEFMNDGGPIRVDFVNLREVLEGSREALLKLDEYEHREKLHMDRCRHDMERIVALEQQNEALASRLDCARRLAHSWIDTPFTSMDRDTMRTLGNELLRTIGEKWIAESNPGSAVEKPVHPRYTRCPGTIDGEHQWERWENESTGETGMECAVCHDGYPTLSS